MIIFLIVQTLILIIGGSWFTLNKKRRNIVEWIIRSCSVISVLALADAIVFYLFLALGIIK